MTSFVLHPAHNVPLVQVNALLNTPLFDRIRQCMPAEWEKMTGETSQLGIDLERDLDRVAVTADGMAMSGFFDGKPIARNIARSWPDLEEREYRGHPIWLSKYGGIAQIGNLLLMGARGSMDKLLDRALDPAPEGADPQDVYGDVFMRSDLSDLRGRGEGANPDVMRAILEGLSGVTVRANVWDTVAVSVEGKPQPGRDDAAAQLPYRNSGSQSVMPGQMYMNTRQMTTMIMYGIIPAKIWFSVTCFGATPFK
jgi:hypothetical protein